MQRQRIPSFWKETTTHSVPFRGVPSLGVLTRDSYQYPSKLFSSKITALE